MTNRKSLAFLAEKLSPDARERAVLKACAMSDAMDLEEPQRAQVTPQCGKQTEQVPLEPASARYRRMTPGELLARWRDEPPLLPGDQFPPIENQPARPEDIF
jgi:hypothetical protein